MTSDAEDLPLDNPEAPRAALPRITADELLAALDDQRIAIISPTTKRARRVLVPEDIVSAIRAALTEKPDGPDGKDARLLAEDGGRVALEDGSGFVLAERGADPAAP